MKNAAFVAWVALRIRKWVSWVSFLVYSFAITITADRSSYLDHFGRPLHSAEAWLFWPTHARRNSRSFRTYDARAGGDRETRLLPPGAAKSAPFELTGTAHCPSRLPAIVVAAVPTVVVAATAVMAPPMTVAAFDLNNCSIGVA